MKFLIIFPRGLNMSVFFVIYSRFSQKKFHLIELFKNQCFLPKNFTFFLKTNFACGADYF